VLLASITDHVVAPNVMGAVYHEGDHGQVSNASGNFDYRNDQWPK